MIHALFNLRCQVHFVVVVLKFWSCTFEAVDEVGVVIEQFSFGGVKDETDPVVMFFVGKLVKLCSLPAFLAPILCLGIDFRSVESLTRAVIPVHLFYSIFGKMEYVCLVGSCKDIEDISLCGQVRCGRCWHLGFSQSGGIRSPPDYQYRVHSNLGWDRRRFPSRRGRVRAGLEVLPNGGWLS